MKKDKKDNIVTLTTGAKISIEISRKLVQSVKKKAPKLETIASKHKVDKDDPLVIGGIDVRELKWDDFFTEELTNPIFIKAVDKENNVRPFIMGESDNADKIGMWLGVTDEENQKSFGRFIYKDCIGTLMVAMFVLINCTKLRDKRGHRFSVATMKGANPLYEHFKERIIKEAASQTKAYFAYLGGVVESICRAKATSPEKIIDIVDEYIQG